MLVLAKKVNKKIILSLFFVFILFFAHNDVFAASLSLSPASGSYNVGDTINVRVVLSSADQSANAVSSTIDFPKALLTLNSISKANSLVSLWAQEPNYSNANGTANLEGVILNGYTGGNGTIVTLSFKAKAIGNANIKFTTSSVLANDGQGTNILLSTGQANFNISPAKQKEVSAPVKEDKVAASLTIEELKKNDPLDSTSKFLISSIGRKAKALYHIEIDSVASPWENQDSGIFTTPVLVKGDHSIKVYTESTTGDIISSNLSFNINSILVPVFTDYSKDIQENQYIVAKGLADPNTNIVVNSDRILPDGANTVHEEATIKSNEKGLFTYVGENKALSGVYVLTAQARARGGLESDKSLPIKISVATKTMSISTNIVNMLSILIPIMALIFLLILLMIWGWHHILRYRQYIKKRLLHTEALVVKSFDILNEDVAQEIKVFKKIKAGQLLTKDERLLINQLGRDMESASKAIMTDIKESEK